MIKMENRALSLMLAMILMLTLVLGNGITAFAVGGAGDDTYVPLEVSSGFNVDIIAESYPATAATTDAVDIGDSSLTANFSFYSKGYVADYNAAESASTDNSGGLPDSGLVTTDNNSLNAGVKYQLGDYSDDNALKLTQANTTGTLTFTNAGKYARVSILGTGGSGNSTISVVVNYTDSSSDSAKTFTCKDWYSDSGYIMSYMGRIYRGPTGGTQTDNLPLLHNTVPGAHGPNLYGFEVVTDSTKNIASISFTQTTRTNNTETTSVIMAVSGVIYSGEADPNDTQSTSSSGGGSSSSGGGSSRQDTPAPVAPVIAPLDDKSSGTLSTAINSAATSNGASFGVKLRNVSNFTRDNAEAILQKAKSLGKKATVSSDIMSEDGKFVEVRVTVDPELIKKTVRLDGYTRQAQIFMTETRFKKHFDNKTAVVSLGQDGAFGQTAKIAAKIDLDGFDSDNLYFYSYDKKTNSYKRIPQSAYRIDKNGYLHFETDNGGDIIISSGPLVKK